MSKNVVTLNRGQMSLKVIPRSGKMATPLATSLRLRSSPGGKDVSHWEARGTVELHFRFLCGRPLSFLKTCVIKSAMV